MGKSTLMYAVALTVVLGAALAWADKPANTSTALYRTSTIESMKVRNDAGDDLGKIKDLVVDAQTGRVTYVALDFGGFLGIGDKLFAVPWHAFKFHSSTNGDYLVLNVTKEHLKTAPGFDKNHWPNMADPEWSKDVHTFYGPPRTAAR